MRTLNLSWLEDFLALSGSGNFSRAADERHMTQPAFSRRIRALEEWLGVDLFDRSQQPAKLTETGCWFEQIAREMLARAAQLPSEAQVFAEAQSGRLRIASTHALSFMFMPRWLRGLESQRVPGQIQLVSDVLPRCEALLIAKQVQFLLTHSRPGKAGVLDAQHYPNMVVGHDRLLPVSSPSQAGEPLHCLNASTIKTPLKLLSYSAESGIGGMVSDIQAAVASRVPTQVVFTAHLASVLRTMAIDGRGMAWLPRTLIADDLAYGTLVLAASQDWELPLEVKLYRDKTALSAAGEAFWTANTVQCSQPDQVR